ncbi:MAG TPA: DUF6600 domain-containing protein [Vicinamibacterales bacterium]|nr:DUF6600 domain-containing protein [Vicinamibacterales bacterium]
MTADRVRLLLIASAVLALIPGTAVPRAQAPAGPSARDIAQDSVRDFSQDVPAHLSFVDGEVTLERNGKLEPAETNLALLAGDRIQTRGGRVEILYPDGSTLHIDHDTKLDLISSQLARLLAGTLRVTIPKAPDDLDYRVDAPAAFVAIKVAGEYRIDTGVDQHGDPDVALTVVRGTAELVNDLGRTLVRAGRQAVANEKEAPSESYSVNLANFDEFDRWSDDRRTAHVATDTAAYVPDAVEPYTSTLDDYGSWTTEPLYGAVWYPRVAADWHPYSQGRWSYSGYYGWLWVGIDPWAWPTHHYGRWGYNNRWYWIPGQAWSPAWVAWGYAPGYVSWCPLGYNNRAVIGWTAIGTQTVSAFRVFDPFSAWTVVPSNQFAPNMWVREHAVARAVVPQPVRDAFVERPTAPTGPRMATPRETQAPLRAPTQSAGPQTRARSGAGPFEAARVPSRTGAMPPRDPIRSIIIGTASEPARETPRPADRRVDRSDGAPANRGGNANPPVILRGSPTSSRPDVGVGAATPTPIDVPRAADRTPASHATPRPANPFTYSSPARAADPGPRAAPRAPAPGSEPPPRQGGAVVVDRTPPATHGPRTSAPPAQPAPSHSRGEAAPAARTSAPPSPAPPSAAPPPAHGGGSGGRGTSGAAPPSQAGRGGGGSGRGGK